MKRVFILLLFSLCSSAIVVLLGISVSRTLSFSDAFSDAHDLAASVFFVDSITTDGLKAKFSSAQWSENKIKVLIVPGHDNEAWGTEFRGVREADMNAAVGEELARILSADSRFLPVLVRAKDGYAKEFQEYFVTEKSTVKAFVANKRQVMKDLMKTSMVHKEQDVVHNKAATDTVWRLYAINKWANENNVDIVLHLHFNDYPGRSLSKPGRYDGFSFYVPETQFSNAKASRAIADSFLLQFSRFYSESNFPLENGGIVLDQDLIAIGAYNTLDPAVVLIEYGYIYEQKFLDEKIREPFMKEFAFQTYLGLNKFFNAFEEAFRKYPTSFLPHEWKDNLSTGTKNNLSVLSLQSALLFDGLYPPEGDKRTCPITGSFGPCTSRAVSAFQQKYGITPATGVAGAQTLVKLNEKYGY